MASSLYRLLLASGIGLALAAAPAAAQDLSYKEAREILLQAENTAAEMENLLNAIANSNSGPAEVQLFIDGSYSPGPNQIFLNKNVVIEDNIDPSHRSHEGAQDKAVTAYLTDFDVAYTKTDDPSVKFDRRKSGPIRRGDFLFVNVLYESRFSAAPKTGGTYTPTQRVMTLRAEKNGNRWRTLIAGVRFATRADSSTAAPPDQVTIQKTPEQKAGSHTASGADVFNEVMQAEARREYAEARTNREKAYAEALERGETALKAQQFDDASEAFTQAIGINSYDYRARAKLQEVDRARERRKALETKKTGELTILLDEAEKAQDYAVAKQAAEQLLRRKKDDQELKDRLRKAESRLYELDQLESRARLLDPSAAVKFWAADISRAQKDREPSVRIADLLVFRAKAYLVKNDFKRALQDLAKATATNPHHRMALLTQAQVHLKMEEPYKALNDYTILIASSKSSPIFYKDRAGIKTVVKDTAGAIADFDQAIALDNTQADLYHGRGLLLLARHRATEAVADFSAAADLQPTEARHPFRRGLAFLALGDVDKAAADFAAARNRKPTADESRIMADRAWAIYEQGNYSVAGGNFTRGLQEFTSALKLNPALVEASLEKGTVLMRMLEFDQAERTLSQSVEANPSYTPVRVARSAVRLALNKSDAAMQDCMTALQFEPKSYIATIALGDVYAAQDRLADALIQYKKAIALNEEQPNAYLAMGRTLSRAGKTSDAEDALSKGLKYSGDDKALAYAELAENAVRGLDYKAAINYADKSVKTGKALPEAYLAKGRAEVGLGQTQQALSDLLRVADKDPEQFRPAAHVYAAAAYCRQGQAQRARQQLSKLQGERRKYLGTAYMVAVADCRLMTDSVDQARMLYNEALVADPACAMARYGLARCAAKGKDTQTALALLKESLAKNPPLSRDEVEADPAFAAMTDDKRFRAVLKEVY